jgi:menaquinone-dependent protoporphyrinogen oxidase
MEIAMDVLVVFETVEGQTEKIARFSADQVGKLGREARLINAGNLEPVSFERVGSVILAAPVHQRRHPRAFEAFLEANRQELEKRNTLMISVSLNAAFPEGLQEANEYLVEMKMRTGFAPDAEALVGGAVRTGQYDYFAMQVLRHVVLRGRDFDPSAGEHEFTDWEALAATILEFVEGR